VLFIGTPSVNLALSECIHYDNSLVIICVCVHVCVRACMRARACARVCARAYVCRLGRGGGGGGSRGGEGGEVQEGERAALPGRDMAT